MIEAPPDIVRWGFSIYWRITSNAYARSLPSERLTWLPLAKLVLLRRCLIQQMLHEVIPSLPHPEIPLTESVTAIREDQHVEVFIGIHKLLYHFQGVIWWYVGVHRTMSYKELPFQVIYDQLVRLIVVVRGPIGIDF